MELSEIIKTSLTLFGTSFIALVVLSVVMYKFKEKTRELPYNKEEELKRVLIKNHVVEKKSFFRRRKKAEVIITQTPIIINRPDKIRFTVTQESFN